MGKNLAKAMPEKVAELKKMLYSWRSEINAPVPSEKNPQYDADFVAGKGKKEK